MEPTDIRRWHERREALFPTKIPYTALSAINAQLPRLEIERAMRALDSYAQQRPYKGFYWLRYMVHYERAAADMGDARTLGTAPRGAPPAEETGDIDAERAERERYESLPDAFRADCARRFAEWGWPAGSRAWRLLCIDAYDGREIERYRRATNIFTETDQRKQELAERAEYMQRRGFLELITQLRHEIVLLGGKPDVVAR